MEMIHAYVPCCSASTADITDDIPTRSAEMQLTPIAIKDFPYVRRFREITQEMADLYAKKNADYGNSFAKSIEEFGLVAGLVRLSDKWNRVCELVKNNGDHMVANESLKDTAIDGACYFIMLAMELERLSAHVMTAEIEFGSAEGAELTNMPQPVGTRQLSTNDSIVRTPRVTC